MIGRGDVVNVAGSQRCVVRVEADGWLRVAVTRSARGIGRRVRDCALIRTAELDAVFLGLRAARRRLEAGYPDLARRALQVAQRDWHAANIRGDDAVGAMRQAAIQMDLLTKETKRR